MPKASRLLQLRTPAVPCVVPPRVFDDFAWCESDELGWRCAGALDRTTRIDGSDPARMVFVFHRADANAGLPSELARLHAFGLGLEDELALAPYAIDDATDTLHAKRMRPRDVLWLAADNLNALFWGLHDWAHFHNHGPFEERAWTELQCDATALAWLGLNRELAGIEEEELLRARGEVVALATERFAREGVDAGEREVVAALELREVASPSLAVIRRAASRWP
jgi:hypothetical protein